MRGKQTGHHTKQPRSPVAQEKRERRTSRPPHAAVARMRDSRRKIIAELADDFLIMHRSQNHSAKTVEWHATAIGLLVHFLDGERIVNPLAIETNHLRRWVIWLGTSESMRLRQGRTTQPLRSKRTLNPDET